MQFTSMASHGSDDEQPSPEDFEQWYAARHEPDNEVPVGVPISAVLARTADVAVVLTSVHACTTGFGCQLSVRLRQSPAPDDDVFGQFMSNAGAGGQFLLGVQFADGRRGSSIGGPGDWPPRPARHGAGNEVSLSSGGGGGGARRFNQAWWVSPLPPPGPLLIVVRWDARGIAERVIEVDGTAISEAGQRAEVLWPWESDRPEASEPDEPLRPTSGWFAQP